MEKRKIKVLHLVRDDKFIDRTLDCFEQDGRFESSCIMIADNPDYKFKYIINFDKIRICCDKKAIKRELQRRDYDVLFIYALTDYYIINYIPDDKIVIWWAWGYDIYGSHRFLNIPLYKPLTKKYIQVINSPLSKRLKNYLINSPIFTIPGFIRKSRAIKRIDYFQPVIHTEFEMMQNVKGFRAKEFYYPKDHYFTAWIEDELPEHGGNIIIGNSATFLNNHLDVWSKVKDYIPKSSKVFFPVSYGDPVLVDYLLSKIKSNNVEFLRNFMPLNDYYNLVDTCSYAIFGVLREAAMGNIYRCVAKGIKLFLYKDSIPYHYLKDLGCEVYAIEEIDENSFMLPLTKDEAIKNRLCLIKDKNYVESVRERAISELQEIVSNKFI